MTIHSVARKGDRRATLVAMRDKLARDMDRAEPAVVAQIAGRLAVVLEQIESLPVAGEVSSLDELNRRRQNRVAKTKGEAPSAGKTPAKRSRQRRPASS